MMEIKELIEIFVYCIAVVCVGDAIIGAVIIDTIRLNKIRRLTKECKDLINQVKNK